MKSSAPSIVNLLIHGMCEWELNMRFGSLYFSISVLLVVPLNSISSIDVTNWLFISFWGDYIKSGTTKMSTFFSPDILDSCGMGQMYTWARNSVKRESYMEGWMRSHGNYLIFLLKFWCVCDKKSMIKKYI